LIFDPITVLTCKLIAWCVLFEALEPILKQTAGKYCVGDEVIILTKCNQKNIYYSILYTIVSILYIQIFGVGTIFNVFLRSLLSSPRLQLFDKKIL